MLEESPLSVSQKALLVQSAAAEISFQPRFLYVRLVGTAKESLDAELPAMDTNGRADAYVKCRLVPASGVPYPKRGVMSRTIYRTTAPQWNEELELALVGGSVRCDGTYENRSAAKAEVLFQVFDADVGVWGWLYIALRLSLFAMLVGAASAYITGYDDKMSRAQVMVAKAVGITATVLTMASYVYSRLLRTQDQLIGEAKVPLSILMDQKDHSMHLKLRQPTVWPTSPSIKRPPTGQQRWQESTEAKLNARGGRGILNVTLSLAER